MEWFVIALIVLILALVAIAALVIFVLKKADRKIKSIMPSDAYPFKEGDRVKSRLTGAAGTISKDQENGFVEVSFDEAEDNGSIRVRSDTLERIS